MAGNTISTKIALGVTLGNPGFLSPLTITSTGEIAPSTAGATALFVAITAGYVLNQGKISSGNGGAGSAGAFGVAGGAGGDGGIGVALSAGSVTNTGTISSGTGGTGGAGGNFAIGGQGGTGGIGVALVAGGLTNAAGGMIVGGTGGAGGIGGRTYGGIGADGGRGGTGGIGVKIATGNVTNAGTIAGGNFAPGGYGGPGPSGFGAPGLPGYGGVGVQFQSGGTLTNAGLIRGGFGLTGTVAAVNFGAGDARLILAAGASFSGAVVANAAFSNVLELTSGPSAGTINGLGSRYIGFWQIAMNTGAQWTLSGANTLPTSHALTVSGAGTLTNTGTVAGGTGVVGAAGAFGVLGGTGGTGGTSVDLTAGTLTNAGTIAGGMGGTGGTGGYYAFGGQGGTGGIGATLVAGSLTNASGAMIVGGVGGAGGTGGRTFGGIGADGGRGGTGGIGVKVVAGSLTNNGTIAGGVLGSGGSGGFGPSGLGNSGIPGYGGIGVVFQSGGTLTNAGLIRGGVGITGTVAAVDFGAGAARLILAPGASFNGAVVGNAAFSNVLQLKSSASAGTIGGFGTQFIGMSQVIVDSGARWTLSGANTFLASQPLTVSGAGTLTNSVTLVGGIGSSVGGTGGTGGIGLAAAVGNLTNASGATIAGGTGGSGYDGTGGTGVDFTAGSLTNSAGAVIEGGSGGFTHIFIDASGTFGGDISGNGGLGLDLGAGSVTNNGLVKGGYGFFGGIGVDATGGTLINNSIITGGTGNTGGIGLNAVDGHFTNASGATITGGVATGTAFGPLGVGAIGVRLAGGSLTNIGKIAGSEARPGGGGGLGNGRVGGAGGIGVDLIAGSVTNDGTIASGAGGAGGAGGFGTGGAGGAAGAGVALTSGGLINDGMIAAAAGGNGGGAVSIGGAGGNGGVGVTLTSGNLINNGVIAGGAAGSGGGASAGGAGGAGGIGVYLTSGSVTNHGTIVGGAGGDGGSGAVNGEAGGGGVGVRFKNGGTLIDSGFIAGGKGHLHTYSAVYSDAVYFGAGDSRLILGAGASFTGAVVANASFSNVLQLTSGASTGTISSIGTQFTNFGIVTIDANANWTLIGSSSLALGATLTNAGTLTLLDATVGGAGVLINNGGIFLDPSSITISDLLGTGSVRIDANSTLAVTGSVANSETIVLYGAGAHLSLGSPDEMTGVVTDFSPGESINLAGVDPGSVSYAGGELTFDGGKFALALNGGLLQITSSANGTAVSSIACFAAGTRIATPSGAVVVEALRRGDLVTTASGGVPSVRWIGYRTLDLTRHPEPERAQPIRIAAAAFGAGVPSRDLRLSPDHAVLLGGMLIPVKLLRNDASIVRETACRTVTYVHVELDTHDVLLAEGVAAESYLDTGNRGMFENADAPLVLHPDFGNGQVRREAMSCAPFAADPPRVEPVWQMLAERAVAQGLALPEDLESTTDPALHVMVGGLVVQPISRTDGCYAFMLPNGRARLVSRNRVPSETRPWIDDLRLLGVAVTRLTVRRFDTVETIPLDHPRLRDGWWTSERHGNSMWRWTNGNAELPLNLTGPAILEVQLTAGLDYPAGAEAPSKLGGNQVAAIAV